MSSPYVGEIRLVGFSFAPAGWAFCNGATLAISENDVLFALIGTTFGGDGQSTFNLPDLQGRTPVHQGQGPGISQSYVLGQLAGVESVTLTTNQIPVHSHALLGTSNAGISNSPAGAVLGNGQQVYSAAAPSVQMDSTSLVPAGGSQPHENMQPFLVLNWIISLFGIFPSQT